MYFFYRCLYKLILVANLEKYLSDESFLKIQYYITHKKRLNLKNPQTYNEKIQWLKLHDHNELYPKIVDKADVRNYVKERIGEEHLIKCYGVFDSPNLTNLETLPDSFVIKCTHDSGNVYVCENKEKFDKKKFGTVCNGLNYNFYYKSREWPYKSLKPRLIVEENLSRNGKTPADYKLMCFNGKVKFIQLHEDRFSDHKSYLYDINGVPTKFNNVGSESDNDTAPMLDMSVIKKMISLAEILAKDFFHVRVDFYFVDNKIYFGELTLYDSAGLVPWFNNGDEILGELLDLSFVDNKKEYKEKYDE